MKRGPISREGGKVLRIYTAIVHKFRWGRVVETDARTGLFARCPGEWVSRPAVRTTLESVSNLSYDSEGIMSQMKMDPPKRCVWDLGEVKIAFASGSQWGTEVCVAMDDASRNPRNSPNRRKEITL